MKQSTTTIPTNLNNLFLLKNGKIVAAFMNSLPPRDGDLHGTSVEFFFEGGQSCSIDGFIIDIAPKEEVFFLHFGVAREMDVWQKELQVATIKPVIETINLHTLWSGMGLGRLLAGPRKVRFYKKMGSKGVVGEEFTFDAIQLCLYGVDDAQNIFLHASQDFPGDVIITIDIPSSEFILVQ